MSRKENRNTEILLRMLEEIGSVIKRHIGDLTKENQEDERIYEQEIINKLDSNIEKEAKKITYITVRDRIVEIISNNMANKPIIKKYLYEYGVDSFKDISEDKLHYFMEKLDQEFPREEV